MIANNFTIKVMYYVMVKISYRCLTTAFDASVGDTCEPRREAGDAAAASGLKLKDEVMTDEAEEETEDADLGGRRGWYL